MKKKLNSIIKNQFDTVSPWIKNNLCRDQKRNKILLDIASGNGRHSLFASSLGYQVISADLKLEKLYIIKNNNQNLTINIDFESKFNWPFKDNFFDVIIVTNYLHRALFKNIFNGLKKNGLLIYETFSIENIQFGKPRNPDFLLKPQELLQITRKHHMKIINYEELITNFPKNKAVQRICTKKL